MREKKNNKTKILNNTISKIQAIQSFLVLVQKLFTIK